MSILDKKKKTSLIPLLIGSRVPGKLYYLVNY